MKLVEVIWRDIISDGGWRNQNKTDNFITDIDQSLVKQIAYLYEEDENQIVLIDSYFKTKDLYGTINVIPKGCVLKMVELSPGITEW